MDLQIHFTKHRRRNADCHKKGTIRSEVDGMVIHVIMKYVLGDGTRQTEKNRTVAITMKGER